MVKEMKKLILQAFKFFCISGIGWILDFSSFFLLTKFLNLSVFVSNILSSIPAVTYVFFTSTKKLFINSKNQKISINCKYLIYLIYQICFVCIVSLIAETIYKAIFNYVTSLNISFILENLKVIIKICITPFTMILNFIFMKFLIEKL